MKSSANALLVKPARSPKFRRIVIYNGRFRGHSVLSKDKGEAKKILLKKIKTLINETYDNYPFEITEEMPHVCIAVIDKNNGTLAGMMMLVRNNCRGLEYGEVGASIVKKAYRGFGIQSSCMKELYPHIVNMLFSGIPLLAFPRAFSAHSQLQAYNVEMPNEEGKPVKISIPGGFLLFYIVEKDETGNFVLENDIAFTAWPSLDKIVEKEVYLPPRVLEKGFHIFNPQYRPDTRPAFITPFFSSSGELKIECLECSYENDFLIYPENDYFKKKWKILASYFSIIGYQADPKQIKKSRSGRFTYSDQGSPNKNERSVHIESISSFNFMDDFEPTMKVITVCLQMSDFSEDITKVANTALIDLLIRFNFVPTAQFDLLYRKKRTRIAYFTKWQDIRLEAKYEILAPYREQFEIFNHDVNIQGLGWPKFVNIVEPEGVWALKSDDAEKQESAYTFDHYFLNIAKGADSYNHSAMFKYIKFPIASTPFFKPIKEYLKRTDRTADAVFINEINVLDHQIIADFEKILAKIPEYIVKFNLEPLDVAILSFREKDITIKLYLRKRGSISPADWRFSSIFGQSF